MRENRPVALTCDRLNELRDDEVELEIAKVLISHVYGTEDQQEQYRRVDALSPGLKMLWGTWLVDGEVNNGGFNQFFWNSSGQFAMEAIEGFRVIGADEHAGLVEDAVELFFEEADRLRPFRQRHTLEAFSESYEHTDSGALDTRNFALRDFSELRVRYIRDHLDEFVIVE
jgi:hypothetical protein